MEPHIYTLAHGLPVIFINTNSFPTLSTLLLVGAGSRYEYKINNGIAHFFEHMAFKGSKKYPSSFIISSTIEGLGGVFNAFTDKDHTGYWIKALGENFEVVIDVLSDMILHPLLIEEEIEREKGVITEEINMYEDTPQRRVAEFFEALLYQDHPLGYDIAGTKKTVKNFNRGTFTNYMEQLYHPNNAVLVVAGGFRDEKFLLNKIESAFKDWKLGEKASFKKIKESQEKPQLYIKYKKTEQAHFCLGFRTFSFFNNQKYALSLLTTILGGGMSSRLFMEVRERRGLCYYIGTGRQLYHDVGNIVTQAGVTNNLDKIKESLKVILDEHKKITKGQVRKEELTRAKELLKGRLFLSLEDSFNVASFFASKKLLENKIESPQEVIKKVEAVSLDDIVSLSQQIFVRAHLNFALIGPFESSKEFEEVF